MLETMSIGQLMHWQAFLRIREEERVKEKDTPGKPAQGPVPTKVSDARSLAILDAYQAQYERRGNLPGRR